MRRMNTTEKILSVIASVAFAIAIQIGLHTLAQVAPPSVVKIVENFLLYIGLVALVVFYWRSL